MRMWTCAYCKRPMGLWAWLFNRDRQSPVMAHLACPVEPKAGA